VGATLYRVQLLWETSFQHLNELLFIYQLLVPLQLYRLWGQVNVEFNLYWLMVRDARESVYNLTVANLVL
jgi:hypothetical protein